MQARGPVTGIPWYARDEYAVIRAQMADGVELHATFEEWERDALRLEAHLVAAGSPVMRIPLAWDDFHQWCVSQDLRATAASRAKFAAERSQLLWEKEHPGDRRAEA